MPINFAVDAGYVPTPFIDALGVTLVEFDLAEEDQVGVAVMSVMLIPGAACQPGPEYTTAYDLRFGIRLRDLEHDWKFTPPDFSVESRDKYIRREDRPLVRSGIERATKALIEYRHPALVTMSTYYPNLCPRGLAKYDGICRELGNCGYETTEMFDGEDGKRYWLFSRMD